MTNEQISMTNQFSMANEETVICKFAISGHHGLGIRRSLVIGVWALVFPVATCVSAQRHGYGPLAPQ